MLKSRFIYISPFSYLLLTACGGGGGGFSSRNIEIGGNVVKGPLNNATVFVDYNANGILDTNEPSTKTDVNGGFSLTTTDATAQIVAITDSNTIDTSTGNVLDGVILKAPGGSTVVSPSSTLIQESGLTASQVASALDLSDVDILNFCSCYSREFSLDLYNIF